MKKVIFQICLILLIIIIGIAPSVMAADATITVSSNNIKKGDTFTVTVNIPSNAVGYQGTIKVFYKDEGITDSSGFLMKVTGVDGEYAHPGNMTATFTAKSTGETIISVDGCVISDKDTNTLKNPAPKSIIIASNEPKPTEPSTPSTPSEPNTGGNSTGNSGNSGTTTGNNGNTGNTGNAGNTGNTGNTEKPSTNSNTGTTNTNGPKFTDVNETVYTTTRCNLRESYSTNSKKIAIVNSGTKLTRKGIGDNNWSKCEYNGKVVYVSSEYLTTNSPDKKEDEKENNEKEVVFKDTHENLYAKQSCNLRASWSTESEKVGYLEKGQAVERTGYADNGWSRIKYNGKTVYVASRLLVVEKPEEDEKGKNTIANNTVKNTIENKVQENIIEDPTKISEEDRLKEIQNEIGVLPEVGVNVANIAYIVVTLIAIAGIISGIIYIKKNK